MQWVTLMLQRINKDFNPLLIRPHSMEQLGSINMTRHEVTRE